MYEYIGQNEKRDKAEVLLQRKGVFMREEGEGRREKEGGRRKEGGGMVAEGSRGQSSS